jgi:hypothetical protein
MENYAHDRQRSYYQHREEELDRDTESQLEDDLGYSEEEPPHRRQRIKYTPKPRQQLTYKNMFSQIIAAFIEGWTHVDSTQNSIHRREKKLREQLDEKQIDKMVEDSFPSSDPPSTY